MYCSVHWSTERACLVTRNELIKVRFKTSRWVASLFGTLRCIFICSFQVIPAGFAHNIFVRLGIGAKQRLCYIRLTSHTKEPSALSTGVWRKDPRLPLPFSDCSSRLRSKTQVEHFNEKRAQVVKVPHAKHHSTEQKALLFIYGCSV